MSLPLPRATRGPFTLEPRAPLVEARDRVLGSPAIGAELARFEEPPDVRAALDARLDVIGSTLADVTQRTSRVGERLHELLAELLDRGDAERLRVLGEGVERLRDLLDGLQRSLAGVREDRQVASLRPHVDELRQVRSAAEALAPTARKSRRVEQPAGPAAMSPDEFPRTRAEAGELVADERALTERLIAELELAQNDLLAGRLDAAREQREFRALMTQWQSSRDELTQTAESLLVSEAQRVLGEAMAETYRPTMSPRRLGQDEPGVDELVVTDAFETVGAALQRREAGSFGIAGPRGVGKSTLLGYVVHTPSAMAGVPAPDPPRTRIGVLESVPVRYDGREFLLHLFAQLCQQVFAAMTDNAADADFALRRTGATGPRGSRPMLGTGLALALLAPAMVAIGVVLLGYGVTGRSAIGSSLSTADIGAGLFAVGAATLGVTLYSYLRSREVRPVWLCAAGSAAAATGGALLLIDGGWGLTGAYWLAGWVLVAVGLPAIGNLARTVDAGRTAVRMSDPTLKTQPTRETLRDIALDQLRRIRGQQTIGSRSVVAAKLGGGSTVPVGVDMTAEENESWTEREQNFPELVADLRAFVRRITAANYDVVIGIDELDKLRSEEQVQDFLNEIKSIFGIPHCYFLVSVSEDAKAGFERRGVPFRDVFDSAFDDVYSVSHLDFRYARRLLQQRLFGWSEPFYGLCYVLSGGLARDLVRTTRELFEHASETGEGHEIELAETALALCRREGQERRNAVLHELRKLPDSASRRTLMRQVSACSLADADTARFWTYHNELEQFAEPDSNASGAAPRPSATSARRLAAELSAYLMLATTVLQFFDPDTVADRMRTATTPAGPESLATLAAARQVIAISPFNATADITEFRKKWNLPDLTVRQ